jgi:hypothetical protein
LFRAREVMVDLIAGGDVRSPEGGATGMVVTPLSIKWWFSGQSGKASFCGLFAALSVKITVNLSMYRYC